MPTQLGYGQRSLQLAAHRYFCSYSVSGRRFYLYCVNCKSAEDGKTSSHPSLPVVAIVPLDTTSRFGNFMAIVSDSKNKDATKIRRVLYQGKCEGNSEALALIVN
jgi:hypothetical protein